MKNETIRKTIKETHSKAREATKKKLYKKLMSCRLRWSKENGVDLDTIEEMIYKILGSKCVYCGETITAKNISLDHGTPIHRGGKREKDNLYLICLRCNKRKGIMNVDEYILLLRYLKNYNGEVRKYILRKLATKDRWGG